MNDAPKPTEKLVDVSRDELLFDLEFGMKYPDGKARQRAAVDARCNPLIFLGQAAFAEVLTFELEE